MELVIYRLVKGYQVKLSSANDLLVVGEYMTPEDNPIDLLAGWNMIGYLRTDLLQRMLS